MQTIWRDLFAWKISGKWYCRYNKNKPFRSFESVHWILVMIIMAFFSVKITKRKGGTHYLVPWRFLVVVEQVFQMCVKTDLFWYSSNHMEFHLDANNTPPNEVFRMLFWGWLSWTTLVRAWFESANKEQQRSVLCCIQKEGFHNGFFIFHGLPLTDQTHDFCVEWLCWTSSCST